MLWINKEKKTVKEYSANRNTIAATFSSRKDDFLHYERNYTNLNHLQLLQLLQDAKENGWTALDLSNCGIDYLPDELWEVVSLKVLYLGNTDWKEENYNTFDEIPEKIELLENLEALSIRNVRGVKIPKAIKQMPNLTYLDCFGCGYQKIPDNLLNKNIRGIGIECANAAQLSQLCKIRKLEALYLTGSSLTELPVEIEKMSCLRTLYLRDSKISSIPGSLLNLKGITHFEISNTPLADKIPEEIKHQSAYSVIAYICRQQDQDIPYYFNESKMIVVGQGNVGKSCLVERIVSDEYEEKDSTEGIDVEKWTYNINKKKYILNIWDFGGQEIYHSTHQFFLTKRSLYVFVWDARAEEEYGRIDYWLKTIESFADNSPIIIAINKCDMKTTRVNRIDLKEYKEKYPQIKRILDISCKDNINIQRLRDLIKKTASNLQITKEKWIKAWYDIRKEIEKLGETKQYITFEEYIALCRQYRVENEEAKSLSKYLHDLGIILHYQDDIYLKCIVILSPKWATTAVYKILDSQENVLSNRNGLLKISDLPLIWEDVKMYPEDKYVILLKIMEKFQLCYEIDKESYLVAELLENTSIDCPAEWKLDERSCICIVYRYDFMPAGVMTRFIVKIHNYIANVNGKDMCWRKGVYLKNETAYARVVMKDSISEKTIEVRVSKQGVSSVHERELLFKIRETLKEINESFNKINIEEYVPCNCSPNCEFQFPYSTLCCAVEKKVDKIQCYKSFKEVNVLDLLEGIEIMKKEESNPYTVKIENNPVIKSDIKIEAVSTVTNTINMQEVKNSIMEMQGDIRELKDDIIEELPEEAKEVVRKQFDKIDRDLESAGSMKTTEEVVKSGKLNKLKRWLSDFADEDSEIRRSLAGAKNIAAMICSVAVKFNNLAEKLGITLLPPL